MTILGPTSKVDLSRSTLRPPPDSSLAETQAPTAAFSRIDVVVGGLLALVLAAVLLGLHTTAQQAKAKRVRCMSNLNEIMRALNLYTQDNQDFFPPNPDDGNMIPGYNWCPGDAGRAGRQEFDPTVLANGSLCLVAPYLRSNASLFRCTLDSRRGLYAGTKQELFGTQVPSARTISMNAAVGTVDPLFDSSGAGHSGKPRLSVNAPWLANTHSHRRNNPWRTYGRTAEIIAPEPSKLFVLLEEDPNSINDGSFSVSMNLAVWIDWPGTLHENSGVLAFADGHVEVHRWVDPRTLLRRHWSVKLVPPTVRSEPPTPGNSSVPNSPDWLWLSQRTSASTN